VRNLSGWRNLWPILAQAVTAMHATEAMDDAPVVGAKSAAPPVDERLPPKSRELEAILGVRARPSSRILRWRNLMWAAAAAILLIVLYAAWPLGGSRGATRYTTAPAARGNLTVIVTATGSAQPITQVSVSSELSGTIRKVFVDYNSPVKEGQPVAELDTDKLKATVENSGAKLRSSKAKVADAAATIEEKRAEYDRKKTLAAKGISSPQDLDLAKANYDRAVAQHALALADATAAEADLRLNEINLAKATIRSPIDGIVLKRGVDPGQFVATSLQAPVLFVIAEDLHSMEVLVDVDEADVGKVKIGQNVTFSVDAYPDRRFPAEVRDIRFGSEVVQGVVTYKAVLAIENSELLIRPGMTATAQIVVQEVHDALLVPNAALRFAPPPDQPSGGFLKALLPSLPAATRRPPSKQEETGRNQKVWVLRDGAPIAVPVTIGSTDGRMTEIMKGEISPGQPIIVDAATGKR
jgi:HlyD family secretion protein